MLVLVALLPWHRAAAFEESDLVNPARWDTADFRDAWARDPADAAAPLSRAVVKKPPAVFGVKPDTVAAWMLADGRVHAVSVVLLDAGAFFGFGNSNLPAGESFDAAKMRFDAQFTERIQKLNSALLQLGAQSSGEIEPAKRGGLKLKAQLWTGGGVVARVYRYEHQLLQVDFLRREADARTVAAVPVPPVAGAISALPGAAAPGRAELRLSDIPMIAQGNRGYCGVAILAMVASRFGLTLGAEELAAANGFHYGLETNPDIREMCSMIAREAGVKAQRSPRFDPAAARRCIADGMPVIVFRRWAQERDYIHSTVSAQLARGMAAQLPEPGMDDRKTWPGKDAPAHASIITGWRDDRKEVIFTESWGPQARNRRMRQEEMEATAYYAVYYSH